MKVVNARLWPITRIRMLNVDKLVVIRCAGGLIW